ncbi:hypothetical protein [Escherichia coli]|uniref:hypothetical protein n=1 Tax=Escherichia coli TaxID=562 RepID=UPI003B9FB5BE
MSDNNLRLQVILNAVDKLTRPFRSAQASSRELAAAVKKSRDVIKQLDQAGSSLDSFRKLQAENQKLGDRLNYARQRANLLSQELGAMGPPSQRQVVALGRQRLAVQRLEERQKKLQQQTALVRAELYRAGISAKDDAGATARLARETSRYNQELSKQEARLKRLGEAQRRMNAARASYARSLEVRDRIAGADGKVMMPSGGFPSWGYGFAGMYDSGGYIPRGQFGIVGENGPEIVNGPANVTSRRNTAALAAVVAGMMGVAAAPAELPPLHPLALPAKGGEAIVSRAASVPLVQRIEAPTQIIIQTQPGQSAQDIAREVARQLDERERRLKAKARSNYSDQGGYDA